MNMDIGAYVHSPSYGDFGPAPFLALLMKRVARILQEHHLVLGTDVQPMDHHSLPGILSMLDVGPADDEDGDDEDEKPEYDDRPGVDKLIAFVSASSRRQRAMRKLPPKPQTVRLLGCHPETCAALVMVGITFGPIKADDSAADVAGVGSWTLSLRAFLAVRTPAGEEGDEITAHHSGRVIDHVSLEKAFGDLTTFCTGIRRKHDLQAPKPDPNEYRVFGGRAPRPMPIPMPLGGVPGPVVVGDLDDDEEDDLDDLPPGFEGPGAEGLG
jgi:hypothetical protein